jgi:hypothetical protein
MNTIQSKLHSYRETLVNLKSLLLNHLISESETQKNFYSEQVEHITKVLQDTNTPENYKVAIVGSFKVGKSSFVNALCDVKALASVDTLPETAAITTFTYSPDTYAEIHFIKKSEWEEMKSNYESDKNDIDADRYKRIFELDKERKKETEKTKTTEKNDDKEQKIDLQTIESKYISENGYVERINCSNWNDKEKRNDFAKKLKQFVSRNNPLHYIVDNIVVYVPVPIFKQGIELIDTPGLDDPDRYRVRLTEKKVKDVDVILFLTHSGNSFSEHDKTFIIQQLRRNTIKQLRLIVTQCDETFEKAKNDARDKDEDEPIFEELKQREEIRLREQIAITLNELLSDNNLRDEEGLSYIDKLDAINIDFISSRYYQDNKKELSGIPVLRENLNKMLAESVRIKNAEKVLLETFVKVKERIIQNLATRIETANSDIKFNDLVAQINNISHELNNKIDFLEKNVNDHIAVFNKKNESDMQLKNAEIETILYIAKDVINDFLNSDTAEHWRRKRNGGWGHLYDIEIKIADKIFPRVEIILNRYVANFQETLKKLHNNLEELQKYFSEVELKNKISNSNPINVTVVLDKKNKAITEYLNNFVNNERNNIISRLEDFLTEEVQNKIEEARRKVSNIYGRGTNMSQNSEIGAFYDKIKYLFQEVIRNYLTSEINSLVTSLQKKVEIIFPDIKDELNSIMNERIKTIETTLIELNEQEKTVMIEKLTKIKSKIEQILIGD